jgi:hypothetical protein
MHALLFLPRLYGHGMKARPKQQRIRTLLAHHVFTPTKTENETRQNEMKQEQVLPHLQQVVFLQEIIIQLQHRLVDGELVKHPTLIR